MAARDVDDFGLPIRPFATPEPQTPAQDTTTGQNDHKEATDSTNGPKTELDDKDALAPTRKESAAGQKKMADAEDDRDTFEDARSEPQPAPITKSPSEAKPESGSTLLASPIATESKPEPEVEPTASNLNKLEPAPSIKAAATEPEASLPVEEAAGSHKTHRANNASISSQAPKHSLDYVVPGTLPGERASEFSHQIVPARPDDSKDKDDDWQEMPSYARYDMYDDDDRLIAREHNEEDDETYGYGNLGGAGKGYTRVMLDDDVESANSMDENTQYLFKQTAGTSMMDDESTRDAVGQMQATKDLLTEGQRIAYVGVVRLEIARMVNEADELEPTKKTKKEVNMAAEAMKMWGQKMMIRLYAHMDISEAEQVMIEQLAEHGVVPGDLTPTLLANSRVANPMADDRSSYRTSTSSLTPKSPSEEQPAEPPPPYEALDAEELEDVKTPSQLPSTSKIDIDLRWTVLCDLFLILIADSIYDARSRVLLESVGKSLDITTTDICRFEKKVTEALEMQQAAEKENWNEDEHMEIRRKRALKKRYMMMGLATVGGGLVIGLSAGLLAPVIGAGLAAGFTTIGVTGTSSFLAGAGGAAMITSSAAASGSFIGVRAANRRTGAVKTFEYRPLHNNKRVNLIVTVSGWLTGKVDDVRLPFSTVDPVMGDIYSVLWEPEILRSIGDTIKILATEALTQGLQQVLGSTILMTLMAALQLPIVLTKLSYLIDNPWAVSLDRATAAGKILADSLIERNLGTRPITLVGYSLGARVIFSCLQELAKKGAFGIVQNVYLFGSPIVVKKEEYLRARTVVPGRFVNAYNRNDWILGYLFRLTNGGIRRVAGLAAIEDCPWVENMDVTDQVNGHMEYRKHMPSLLMKCGWAVESEEFTEIEDPDPDNHDARQRQLINDIEEARRELEREGKSGKGSRFSLFGRRKKAEKQDWEVYEDSASKGGPSTEEKEKKNSGVLFDIDAIRAELARDGHYGDGEEELQVKEIKSTLPPMKLDFSPSTASSPATPAYNTRDSLRGTKSAEALPIHDSWETRISQDQSPAWNNQKSPPPYTADGHGDDDDDGVQMTFDTAFDDSEPAAPHKNEAQLRPEFKTASTLPNMTLKDPWGDPDDDDFGKEKEISMTFA